jgi:hypothetical protein
MVKVSVVTFNLILLAGCAHYARVIRQPVETPEQIALDDARSTVHDIENALPSYVNDEGLARMEWREIDAVEDDIDVIEHERDTGQFYPEVDQLQTDWNTLVGLDRVLQMEHVI